MKRKIAYLSNTVIAANIALNEMDSHADTCCLGKNLTPLYYTGEVCNVHAYSDTIAPIKDVQIGEGATVLTDKLNGAEYILDIHQALMFTETLKHSLLNPNQIRYDRHSLCNDPWDQYCSLGISYREFSLFIPFSYQGTVICFESHTPTAEELDSLSHLTLTTDAVCNPKTVELQPLSSKEREYASIVSGIFTSCRISSAIISNDLQLQTPLFPNGPSIVDIALASVSSVYCDEPFILSVEHPRSEERRVFHR